MILRDYGVLNYYRFKNESSNFEIRSKMRIPDFVFAVLQLRGLGSVSQVRTSLCYGTALLETEFIHPTGTRARAQQGAMNYL